MKFLLSIVFISSIILLLSSASISLQQTATMMAPFLKLTWPDDFDNNPIIENSNYTGYRISVVGIPPGTHFIVRNSTISDLRFETVDGGYDNVLVEIRNCEINHMTSKGNVWSGTTTFILEDNRFVVDPVYFYRYYKDEHDTEDRAIVTFWGNLPVSKDVNIYVKRNYFFVETIFSDLYNNDTITSRAIEIRYSTLTTTLQEDPVVVFTAGASSLKITQ